MLEMLSRLEESEEPDEFVRAMDMNDDRGSLIGAGAGPFHLQGMVSLLTASAES